MTANRLPKNLYKSVRLYTISSAPAASLALNLRSIVSMKKLVTSSISLLAWLLGAAASTDPIATKSIDTAIQDTGAKELSSLISGVWQADAVQELIARSGGREEPQCSALHRPSMAHRTANDAACRVAVEKDNAVPRLDGRVSRHKNAANVSSLIRRMGSSQSEKKVPETQRCFVSEKNERKRTLLTPAS